MNNILTIIKKELKRIFTDKRMLASLILPGILIFVLYSLMGNIMTDSFTASDDYKYKIVVINEPAELEMIHTTDNYILEIDREKDNLDEAKNLLENNEIELIIYYENNFLEKLPQGSVDLSNSENLPHISIYYNSTSTESTEIYGFYTQTLSALSVEVTYNFFVNATDEVFDLASDEDMSAKLITTLVPFVLMMFLFSGCMAVSTESIAGEKERGTIATLLVTPVKRSHIALGKVISLAIASLVSSLSSFIGLLLSIPKLMGEFDGITLSMYNVMTYLEIFILMMFMVLFFTVILSMISTYAKSVKEASQYAIPVMVVVMMFAITSMMGSGASNILPLYLIPVYNIIQCMNAVFSLSFNALNFLVTIVSNAAYIGIGIYLLAKMFNSENIMFNK